MIEDWSRVSVARKRKKQKYKRIICIEFFARQSRLSTGGSSMWDMIGNISAIATLVLFVAYIIGHVWRIALLKDTLQEKFELVELTDDVRDSDYYVDFAEEGGQVFAVSSPNGIRHIMFFEILLDSDMQAYGKRILKEFYRVEPNQRVYAHVKIPDSCARIGGGNPEERSYED